MLALGNEILVRRAGDGAMHAVRRERRQLILQRRQSLTDQRLIRHAHHGEGQIAQASCAIDARPGQLIPGEQGLGAVDDERGSVMMARIWAYWCSGNPVATCGVSTSTTRSRPHPASTASTRLADPGTAPRIDMRMCSH